jgi:hypothetical protein
MKRYARVELGVWERGTESHKKSTTAAAMTVITHATRMRYHNPWIPLSRAAGVQQDWNRNCCAGALLSSWHHPYRYRHGSRKRMVSFYCFPFLLCPYLRASCIMNAYRVLTSMACVCMELGTTFHLAPDESDRPLHLRLSATTSTQLARGAALIASWIAAANVAAPSSAASSSSSSSSSSSFTGHSSMGHAPGASGMPSFSGPVHMSAYVSKPPGFGGINLRILVGLDPSATQGLFQPIAKLLGPRVRTLLVDRQTHWCERIADVRYAWCAFELYFREIICVTLNRNRR